jgi:hypothetical protein
MRRISVCTIWVSSFDASVHAIKPARNAKGDPAVPWRIAISSPATGAGSSVARTAAGKVPIAAGHSAVYETRPLIRGSPVTVVVRVHDIDVRSRIAERLCDLGAVSGVGAQPRVAAAPPCARPARRSRDVHVDRGAPGPEIEDLVERIARSEANHKREVEV